MIIVESSIKSPIPSKNLRPSDLKPYQENIEGPYVTSFIKADVLPLTFVIGDGKEYNSKDQQYFNQPLQQNSNYIVFLIFFENQSLYYSTEWSSNVKTMMKSSVENASSQNPEISNGDEIRIDLLIPLIILVLCFLLSLGVIIYQRRLIQNNNRQLCSKYEANSEHSHHSNFDSSSSNRTVKDANVSPVDSYVNDEAVYELPDSVIECIERNQARPEISAGQESSTYMSLKDKREPGNVYQSLKPTSTSADLHQKKEGNIHTMEYENPAFTFAGEHKDAATC